MTTNEWHVDEEVWAAYADGRLDPVAESSVEAHVVRCGQCRTAAREVAPDELEPLWDEISLSVQRPRSALPLRWIRRAGVPEADSVVVGASDGLAVAWSVAVGAALVCGAVAGSVASRYQDVSFLMLAPLVPVLAVAAAFDATDSLRELAAATPYSKLRIVLLRTAAALAVAVPVTLGVGLVAPGLEHLAFAWLLPGLVLTCSALVLLTWFAPWQTGAVTAGVWAAVVLALARSDTLAVLWTTTAQLAFAAAGVVVAVVLVLRTTVLESRAGGS